MRRRALRRRYGHAKRKDAGPLVKYNVHPLDVWGNARDGYEVNDVYPSRGTIEIPEDATNAEIIAALKGEGFIDRNIRASSIHIDGEPGYTLYIGHETRTKPLHPEYELRRAD